MTLSNVPDGFVFDGKSSCYTVPAAPPAQPVAQRMTTEQFWREWSDQRRFDYAITQWARTLIVDFAEAYAVHLGLANGVAAEGSHPRIETEQEEDGRWVAEIPDRPGVMAYGKTEEEAIANTSALLAGGSQSAPARDYKDLCGQLLTALETYVEHYGDEFKIARTAIKAAKEAGIS